MAGFSFNVRFWPKADTHGRILSPQSGHPEVFPPLAEDIEIPNGCAELAQLVQLPSEKPSLSVKKIKLTLRRVYLFLRTAANGRKANIFLSQKGASGSRVVVY